MAAPIPAVASAPALSQKQRRAILKKERRKRKRQALAKAAASDGANLTPEEEDDGERAEEERQRLHDDWLERERIAQEEFRLKTEREETARKRKEDEERMIKEEWEAQQKREEEGKEQKRQEKREREEAVQKMLDQVENELESNGPWMNPEAPATETSGNYGTERDVANCPFFLKTGACRFGDRCSRKHIHPTTSPTLMIRGMFMTFGMEQYRRDDYDTDACLEHSEEELQEHFLEFYHDVLPEFQSIGKVVQFKVSCNFEPHLRGNVYVQFDTEEQCTDAFVKFNGRWYAGKQLHCEICPVTRWKNAICGLFDRQKCPKGKHCNFLHVFRNPGNEFWEADRDLHLSPDRGGEGIHKFGRYSERYGGRSWRQRNSSRSPPRSERSYSRRAMGQRRSRSRSRERSRDSRASQHVKAASIRSNRPSWSRIGSSRRDRHRSRSRDRERDRARNRSRERDRSRSRDKDRERDRSKSRDKDRERDRSRSRDKDRERDRSRSRDKDRERDRSRSRDKDRERDRSRSRDKDRERDRSRSRDKDRERDRSQSKDKDRVRDRSRSRDVEREVDRSQSKDKERDRSGSRDKDKDRDRLRSKSCDKDKHRRESPGKEDRSFANSRTTRHHKHSKKSKKKSKKKHKKKRTHSPEGMTSSAESEDEEKDKEKTHTATDCCEEVNNVEPIQSTMELGLCTG